MLFSCSHFNVSRDGGMKRTNGRTDERTMNHSTLYHNTIFWITNMDYYCCCCCFFSVWPLSHLVLRFIRTVYASFHSLHFASWVLRAKFWAMQGGTFHEFVESTVQNILTFSQCASICNSSHNNSMQTNTHTHTPMLIEHSFQCDKAERPTTIIAKTERDKRKTKANKYVKIHVR